MFVKFVLGNRGHSFRCTLLFIGSRYAAAGWGKAEATRGWKYKGEWKEDSGVPDRPWQYHESPAERAWADQQDRKYLAYLAKNKPDVFLEEMTPNPKHDGCCRGLDLNHPHHRDLQKEFRSEVERICRERGLTNHPALANMPLGSNSGGGGRATKSWWPFKSKNKTTSANTQQEGAAKAPAVDIQKLQAQIKSLQTQNRSLKAQLAEQSQTLQTVLEQNQASQQRETELASEIQRLKNQNTGWSQEKTTLQGQISRLEANAGRLRENHQQLNQEKATLREQRDTHQRRVTELEGQVTGLTQNNQRLTQQLGMRQERIRILEAENAQLQRKLAASKHPRPSWLRVWEGKYALEGEPPVYEAVAAKTQGSEVGFIAQTPKSKQYIAKFGSPDAKHEVAESLRSRSKVLHRTVLSVISEKLAADVYGVLGQGFYYVPKHRLARLEVINRFTQHNEWALAVMQGLNPGLNKARWTITKGIHLLSRMIKGYQDIDTLAECMLYEGDETAMPFMDCLSAGHVPQFAKIDGHTVPILGLMEIMAASRLLADTDVLGGGGKNAGYVIEREGDRPVAVRMVKIDAGEAFNFEGEVNQFLKSFNPLSRGNKLKDPKDMQFGNNQTINIQWSRLAQTQKQAFLHALKRGLDFLANGPLVDFLIYRQGEFNRAVEERVLMREGIVTRFKEAWQGYRDAQTLPQVYGDVINDLEPAAVSQVPFRPKMYGAVNHCAEEAKRLSVAVGGGAGK